MKKHSRYGLLILAALLLAIALFPLKPIAIEHPQAATTAPIAAPPAATCETTPEATFDVILPKLIFPPDEEGQGWIRPRVWGNRNDEATDDIITVPNGRPIYALFVGGYSQNAHLDELLFFNFARHLISKGAYVHYAWWNNLLAPYMERPLHHSQSHPGKDDLSSFTTAAQAADKAFPGEDYQFVADAQRLIAAIRDHNPSAMIIVVGHDMGGSAIVHLENYVDTAIDILAPIDPVGNRNYPWAGLHPDLKDFNWTRWRATRDKFLGYRSAQLKLNPVRCEPVGPQLKDRTEATADIGCDVFVDDASAELLSQNVINLHHRYQTEFRLPFDFMDHRFFLHAPPPGGSTSQVEIPMTPEFCAPLQRCADPGGWPINGDRDKECCEILINGVGWPFDGHGEIVGYRGPLEPIPLAVRVRTSKQCGVDCMDTDWPGRTLLPGDIWLNGDSAGRTERLKMLEVLPDNLPWPDSPRNPDLCLVSPGLIIRFTTMNKPPDANAGDDQTVECAGQNGTPVTLDGRGSSDPDGDTLQYIWRWDSGEATGAVTTISLPKGTHCITLTVRDPSGHIDRDVTSVTVQDTTAPTLTVSLLPRMLWPPNHTMWTIDANVRARDICCEVVTVKLISIVSNQPDNGLGDGDTENDIQDATLNTLDLLFRLRAERAGNLGERRYTATYRATDCSGNSKDTSADVVVAHDQGFKKDPRSIRITSGGTPQTSGSNGPTNTGSPFAPPSDGNVGSDLNGRILILPSVSSGQTDPDGNVKTNKRKRKAKRLRHAVR